MAQYTHPAPVGPGGPQGPPLPTSLASPEDPGGPRSPRTWVSIGSATPQRLAATAGIGMLATQATSWQHLAAAAVAIIGSWVDTHRG